MPQELMPTRARRPERQQSASGRAGHVRQAVKLVLHKPAAGAQITVPEGLEKLDKPGIALLLALLRAVREKPEIRAGRLADDLSDHPDGGRHLHTLLTQDIPLDDESDWTAQLQHTLEAIMREARNERIDALTGKAMNGLNAAEKQELKDLLAGQ